MRFALCVCAAAAALACEPGMDTSGGGGDGTGTATVNGTIHGKPMAAADASSAIVQASAQGVAFQAGAVLVSSAPGICATLTGGKQPRNWQTLVLAVAQNSGASVGPPTGPGVFTVITQASLDPKVAIVYFRATDAQCADLGVAADATAVAGTVTLTSVTPSYTGSFDVQLDTTEHLTGSFKAPGCQGIVPIVQGGTAPACQ